MCYAKYKDAAGNVLTVEYDHDAENPRERDNIGKFIVSPRCKYAPVEAEDDRLTMYDRTTDEKILDKEYIFLPVYVYDHSAVAMNTTGFAGWQHAAWDSGQIGWYVVEKTEVRRQYNVKRISPKLREKVLGWMQGEIETYSRYVNGDVYGYKIEDNEGNLLDSCWGFYSVEDILAEYPEYNEQVA